MTADPALCVSGIVKRFGDHLVLDGINFEAKSGDRILLLGSNGAGKSTLLRVLAGLSRAEDGKFKINGAETRSIKAAQLGYLGHNSELYTHLTVLENLNFTASLLRIKGSLSQELEFWNLKDIADRKISEISKGQQSRAALCRALLHKPQFIFLDEPTSALDEPSVLILKRWLEQHPATIMIMATHDIRRLGDSANRILQLKGGKISERTIHGQSIEIVISSYLEAAT